MEIKTVSLKSRLLVLVFYVLGPFGIHRFYVEKIGTGILYLLTGGIFGIGVIFDVILILFGKFKDKEGSPILNWDFR